MSELYWLTGAQVERLKPYLPKSRGKPKVDDSVARQRFAFKP